MHAFSAHVISGSGRGKPLGIPTINLDLKDVPESLEEGIYACRVIIDDHSYSAALHYGPRPVFGDTPSCEVHLIDECVTLNRPTLTIEIIERIRPVQDFASKDALIEQMQRDIAACRAILAAHGDDPDHQKTDS